MSKEISKIKDTIFRERGILLELTQMGMKYENGVLEMLSSQRRSSKTYVDIVIDKEHEKAVNWIGENSD